MGRIRKVRARNGRLVPFRQSCIAESIREAVLVCGMGDSELADELAGVVTLFLEKRFDETRPPSLDDVGEMIHKVLVETGHVRIAKAYRRLEGRHAGESPSPEALETMFTEPEPQESPAIEVVSDDGRTRTRWNRELLIRSLRTATHIAEAEARVIACSVEGKMLRAGLERVTSGLVRELVGSELLQQGHDDVITRFRKLGVSMSDVEGWVFPSRASTVDPEEMCAKRVLEGFSLEQVYGAPVARAHREGRLHLSGLGQPQRVEGISLDATGPLFPEPSSAEDFLLQLVTLLQAVRPLVRSRITITRFSEAFAAVPRGRSKKGIAAFTRRLLELLTKVDVFGRPVFPPVTLEIHVTGDYLSDSAPAEGQVVRRLSEVLLDELEKRPALAGRLSLTFLLAATPPFEWPESKMLDRVLRAARKHRGVALRLLRTLEDASGGAVRPDGRAVFLHVGAVGVNVPYALALADVREPDEVTAALEGSLSLAVDALFEKYWFLRKAAPETLRGLLARLPGGNDLEIAGTGQGAEIRLWGLPQALGFLQRRGIVTEEGWPGLLARIFGCIDYLAGEERESIRLQISVGGVTDRGARARFLRSTEAVAKQLACDELRDAIVEAPHDVPTLPLVSPVLDEANRPVLEGRFIDRLGPGLPLPARGEDEITNAVWVRRLFESTRLTYIEFEERSEVFEVQEQLFSDAASGSL